MFSAKPGDPGSARCDRTGTNHQTGKLSLHGGKLPTFSRGVHPPETKDATSFSAIEPMPFVEEYILPLSQHIGAPSSPLVVQGQEVIRGQKIAAPDAFVSVALHSPVTGTVKAIEPRYRSGGIMAPSIVITADPFSSQRLPPAEPLNPDEIDRDSLIKAVQNSGIVGLGGAAFPTHVKLAVPEDKKIRYILINGCECEPYLTCDHRIMVERAAGVFRGTEILMRITGAEKAFIAIEANKPDAIDALSSFSDDRISVHPVAVKYPQGGERMLIRAVIGPEVGAGQLPLDFEILVNNVGTAAALADFFDTGKPLIDRVVTVTGPSITEAANLLVPIGTPVSEIIAYCGGLKDSARQVVLGGPMMGISLSRLDVPLVKGVSGILCLDNLPRAAFEPNPCIRCGRCMKACPMSLNPARLARIAQAERTEDLPGAHINSCFECASCSYVCPSGIPLVQWLRMGKAMVTRMKEDQ